MRDLPKKIKDIAKSKFVSDVLTLQFGSSLTLGINFFVSIYLARYLKPEGYGTYALIFSLLGSVRLGTQFGLNQLTIREIAAASGENDRQKLTRYLAFLLKFGFLVHFLVAFIGYLILPALAELIFHQPQVGVMARPLMWIIAMGIFYTLGAAIIEGFRQMQRLVVLENGAALLRALFIIGVLLFKGGIMEVIYATIAAYFLATILALSLMFTLPANLKSKLPGIRELWPSLLTTPITAYLSRGVFIGLYSSLTRMSHYLPLFLLGRYSGVEVVGYYQVAIKIISVPFIAFRAIGRNLLPKLSQLHGKKDFIALKSGFWRVTGVSSLISLAVTLAFLALLPLILIVYGKDYSFARPLVYWLSVYAALSGLDIGVMPLLVATDKLKAGVTLRLISTVVLFPLGVYLVIAFGGRGAAGYFSLNQVCACLMCLAYACYFLPRYEVPAETC